MVELVTGVAVAVISAILVKKVAGDAPPPPAQVILAAESTPPNNISTPGLGPPIYSKPMGFYKQEGFKQRIRSAKKTHKNR